MAIAAPEPPRPPIPVGVRLPLATEAFGPIELAQVCRAALDLGYTSFWVPDHVLVPDSTGSVHPYSAGGEPPFRAQAPWLDPLLEFTWLAAQFPQARFGTSVLILTLRDPVLIARQLATMSWLTRRPFTFGVGSGWLREEYEAVGMPFEKRATRAKASIRQIKEELPKPPAPIEFLWGGVSPIAMRLVASTCDGWLPSKQTIGELEARLGELRSACDEFGRDFDELRIVVKPGPGVDPDSGAIDAHNLAVYAELGVDELILELPYEPDSVAAVVATIERVAARGWL